jgi:ATP-binding cassette subfamily B protein AbcA/BmrA
LLAGTVRENLIFGLDKPIRDEQILEVAEQYHLKDFLLSKGLDTEIGEGGINLSKGQAQRVILLRQILMDRSIWLLDEPTSAMGDDSSATIFRAILTERDRTVLISTHQPQQIKDFIDKIWLVRSGKIAVINTPAAVQEYFSTQINSATNLRQLSIHQAPLTPSPVLCNGEESGAGSLHSLSN